MGVGMIGIRIPAPAIASLFPGIRRSRNTSRGISSENFKTEAQPGS